MIINEEDKTKILKELYDHIDKHCIFRCNPEVKYSEAIETGKIISNKPSIDNSTMMFMLRRLTFNYKMLEYVSALILDQILTDVKNKDEFEFFQLAGLETSCVPLLTGIQSMASRYKMGINVFSVRKERKHYGLNHIIEGIPAKNVPVIFIDDTINSGASFTRTMDACKYELDLYPANNAYAICTFKKDLTVIKYRDRDINLNSLFSVKDFDTKYDPDKYWLPDDCDKSINKRPEYQQGILY